MSLFVTEKAAVRIQKFIDQDPQAKGFKLNDIVDVLKQREK